MGHQGTDESRREPAAGATSSRRRDSSFETITNLDATDWFAACLIVALFAGYPFHRLWSRGFEFNFSYGDPVVAVVLALGVLGVFGHRAVPRYAQVVLVVAGVFLASIVVARYTGPDYVSTRTGLVALVKFLGAVAWGGAVFAVAYRRSALLLPIAAAVSVVLGLWFAGEALHAAVLLDEGRQTGPFHNPNIFANYLLLTAFLALYVATSWIADRIRVLGWLAVCAAAPLVGAMAVTASRGASVGLVVGAIAVVLLSDRVRWWMATLATALAGGVAWYVSDRADGRLAFLVDRFTSEKNLDGRLELWGLAYDAFLENPLVGIGWGQYRELARETIGRDISAHSTFLLVAAESGVVGLVAFLGLAAVVLYAGVQVANEAPGAAIVTAFVVGTLAQGFVADVHTFRSLWIAIGFVAVAHADRFGSVYDLRLGIYARLRERWLDPAWERVQNL